MGTHVRKGRLLGWLWRITSTGRHAGAVDATLTVPKSPGRHGRRPVGPGIDPRA